MFWLPQPTYRGCSPKDMPIKHNLIEHVSLLHGLQVELHSGVILKSHGGHRLLEYILYSATFFNFHVYSSEYFVPLFRKTQSVCT